MEYPNRNNISEPLSPRKEIAFAVAAYLLACGVAMAIVYWIAPAIVRGIWL